MDRRPATGLKGKVQELSWSLQNAETQLDMDASQTGWSGGATQGGQKTDIRSMLEEVKAYFAGDTQRMEEEFKVQAQLQKSENVRLQQQLTTLKGEKTSIHQQIIALQRRVESLEEEIGNE